MVSSVRGVNKKINKIQKKNHALHKLLTKPGTPFISILFLTMLLCEMWYYREHATFFMSVVSLRYSEISINSGLACIAGGSFIHLSPSNVPRSCASSKFWPINEPAPAMQANSEDTSADPVKTPNYLCNYHLYQRDTPLLKETGRAFEHHKLHLYCH